MCLWVHRYAEKRVMIVVPLAGLAVVIAYVGVVRVEPRLAARRQETSTQAAGLRPTFRHRRETANRRRHEAHQVLAIGAVVPGD
jgi:hypothetical protein